MSGITSFRGGNLIAPQIPISSYLSSTISSIRDLFDVKSCRVFGSLIKFLQKSAIPVAILSYDMESTSGDIILNTFSSCINTHGLNSILLRVTSKSLTKKQLLQQLKDSIYTTKIVVYIECFEEWPQDLICFLFEYLIDQAYQVSFVVDISTDPRYLSQSLDASILQKITVEQFFFPEFSEITGEVLWNLTQKNNFPVLSNKIFHALKECRSEAKFMKILKASLLKFFNEKPERKQKFLEKKGIEEFVMIKDHWVESLQLFQRMAETPPMSFEVNIEELHSSVYRSGPECNLVSEFIGKFGTRDFENFPNLDEFVMNLCEKNILSEEEVNSLRNEFLIMPGVGQNQKEVEQNKCKRWKFTFLLPKIRNRVIGYLKPLDEVIKKIPNSELYILNICDFIDTDLMRVTLQQLNFCNFGFNGDMQILFKIIKSKPKHIELNQIFDEFTQRCSVNDGIEKLQ